MSAVRAPAPQHGKSRKAGRGGRAGATKRRKVEDAIEALIALLDALDGDPDREPDGDDDEPSLGSLEAHPSLYPESPVLEYRRPIPRGEPVHDRRSSQLRWSAGSLQDREHDAGDEGEPDADEEHWPQPVHIGQPAGRCGNRGLTMPDLTGQGSARRRVRPRVRKS